MNIDQILTMCAEDKSKLHTGIRRENLLASAPKKENLYSLVTKQLQPAREICPKKIQLGSFYLKNVNRSRDSGLI